MTESSPDLRRRYERIASLYDPLDLPFEYGRYRRLRPLLFQGLSGRILDAGVGTGRNMQFYPSGSEVIGVDLSPAMLRRAERWFRSENVVCIEHFRKPHVPGQKAGRFGWIAAPSVTPNGRI